MTAITTSRDALAKAIWEASRADEGTISATGANIVADALIASGAVDDAATLADDDELVRRINHPGNGIQLFAGVHPPEVREVLRALAAALTERSQA